eukprot:GDKJ01053769.1.p1 GENE.GDKJ01053769.1~~GDKJ01053769.1.p1  ORF type:complete len:144 (+),score=2.27 GDKJ01053769.1:164-595(+)
MNNSTKQTSTHANLLPPDPFRQKIVIELACTIMTQWQLKDYDQFKLTGLQNRFEFQMWKQKAFTVLTPDVYVRLTALVELNRLLKGASSSPEQASIWLNTPNPVFDLESPLAYMLSHGLKGIQDACKALYSDEQKYLHTTFLH